MLEKSKRYAFKIKIFDFYYLLPLIIVLSSLKISGYVISFIFFLPFLVNKLPEIIISLRTLNIKQKFSLGYFLFIFIEIIHGAYFLKDIRVLIYWIPFIFVLSAVYLLNMYQLRFNKIYKKNYIKLIYKASSIYFIFYFIMNVFGYIYLVDFYSIQDKWWMGSSGAFGISSLFFYSLFKLWEENKFKVLSNYSLNLVFYIFLVLMNESRLGILYIVTFTFFFALKNLQLRNFLNSIAILIIVFSTFSGANFFIGEFHNIFKTYKYEVVDHKTRNIISDTKNILSIQDKRKSEFFKGLNKLNEYSNVNKFIGTGWYSSRITMKLDSNDVNNYNLSHVNKKSYSLQGIVALFLDTGFLGIFYIFMIYSINTFYLFSLKESFLNRLFYISMIGINLACLFIGYPLVNIAYILFFLPEGIINSEYKKGII